MSYRQQGDNETADGARRPLWAVPGGPEQQARRGQRARSYATLSPLELTAGRSQAQVRIDFHAASGRGTARASAARQFAAAYGVETVAVNRIRRHRLVRDDLALIARGRADAVAAFAAGLGRALEYAEQLASWVARMYGQWQRSDRHAWFFDTLGARERRAHARACRAAAFRAVARVLTGGCPDDTAPEVDVEVPPWEQVELIAEGIAAYGWIEISQAYDPAEARQLLAAARERADQPLLRRLFAPRHRKIAPRGRQLALFSEPAQTKPAKLNGTGGPVVIVPCSNRKLAHAAPAGEVYTGPLHRLAREAADVLTADGGIILVLSALHGFLPLSQEIEPYDHQWKDPGSITVEELREQAAALGVADAAEVVLLTPSKYTLHAAAIWPHASTPLAHLGIGRQLGRLAALRDDPLRYGITA